MLLGSSKRLSIVDFIGSTKRLYSSVGVLGTSAHMFIANAVMCLLLSWWYKDYSWTDRLWSVVPFVYTLKFFYEITL